MFDPPNPADLLLAGPNHQIVIDRDETRNDYNYSVAWIEHGIHDRTSHIEAVTIGMSRQHWRNACDEFGFRRLPDFSVFDWSYRLGGATATLTLNIPPKEQQ